MSNTVVAKQASVYCKRVPHTVNCVCNARGELSCADIARHRIRMSEGRGDPEVICCGYEKAVCCGRN